MSEILNRDFRESRTNVVPDGLPVNGTKTQDLPPRVHFGLTASEHRVVVEDIKMSLTEALPERGKEGLTVALRDIINVRHTPVQRRDALVRLAAWAAREAALTERAINDRRLLEGRAPMR